MIENLKLRDEKKRIYKKSINIFLIVFDINLCLLDDENYKSDDNSFVKCAIQH